MAEKRISIDPVHIMPEERIDEYLRDDGGSIHAIGNYLAVPEHFTWVPETHRIAHITRMLILIEDDSNLGATSYGGIVGGLLNGIGVHVHDSNNGDAIIADLDGAESIYTNTDWAGLCHDLTPYVFGGGQNNQVATIRWTFEKAGGPLMLDGSKGHYLAIDLNDDFSSLVDHRFLIQGWYP